GEANGITTLKQGDDPGRRSQTRFALGYYLSGFQPLSLERQVEFFSPSWPSLENILPELKTVLPNADLIAFLLLPPCLTQHESHRHCSRVVRWCGLAIKLPLLRAGRRSRAENEAQSLSWIGRRR